MQKSVTHTLVQSIAGLALAFDALGLALAQSGDPKRNAATILGTNEKAALMDAVFASAMDDDKPCVQTMKPMNAAAMR